MTDGKNRLISTLKEEEDMVNDQLSAEYLHAVKKEIERLPGRQREAIELLFMNKMKFKEAAAKMDISVAALIKLRLKGLAMLRVMLKSRHSVEVFIFLVILFRCAISTTLSYLCHF